MTKPINEDGHCIVCNYHATETCFNCHAYVCNEHAIRIPFQEPTISVKIFCPRCHKKKDEK